MIKRGILLLCFLIAVLLSSCGGGSRSGNTTLYGKPGEVLIVMSDEAWEGLPGDSCRSLFGKPFEMLPQYEPQFDISHIRFGSYRDFFLLHRNILIATISPEVAEASLRVEDDPLATSQLVIILSAPDDSSFLQLLGANGDRILTLLANAERDRIITADKRNADLPLSEKIRAEFGVSLTLPAGYQTFLDTTDFLWLQKETGTVIQGILVYEGHRPDLQDDLTVPYLIAYRDELLKRFVSGSVPGSYMTTEKEFAPIHITYSLADGSRALEIRGLWRMENGISMGGPFVSLTRYDDHDTAFTTVEGFVFAAGYSKRNYMRELEAILSTFN